MLVELGKTILRDTEGRTFLVASFREPSSTETESEKPLFRSVGDIYFHGLFWNRKIQQIMHMLLRMITSRNRLDLFTMPIVLRNSFVW